jgi:outer membrane protein assembly factor BamB
MRNRRLAGVLAAVLAAAPVLVAQSASTRTEDLSRAMARVGVERVFAAYAVDHGCLLYGAWICGHDLFIEQFGRSGEFEIVALDLRTGERKWVVQTGRNQLKAGPNPGDRHVVFLTQGDGGMTVVDRGSGQRDFGYRATLNTPTTFAPASSDTTVYVANVGTNQIVALDPRAARPGWRSPVGSLITCGPVVTPRLPRRLVAVGCLDGTVTALPAQGWDEAPPSGPTWTRRLFGAVNAMVVGEGIDQGRRVVSLVASCDDRGLYCLDSTSGEPRWVARTDHPFKEAAVVSGGVVFARAGRLVAIDLLTGADKWKGSRDGGAAQPWERATAGFACDANRAYLRGDRKEIWRVDAKTGAIAAWSHLVEFDYLLAAPDANMLVGLTTDGYVVAYR